MNTLEAYARNLAAAGNEMKVFDWDEAARLILESGCKEAGAGLESDWEWTGGKIFEDGKPVMDYYTYLRSTWATPQISLDGKLVECYKMQSEAPDWDAKTKWPKSALDILKGKSA